MKIFSYLAVLLLLTSCASNSPEPMKSSENYGLLNLVSSSAGIGEVGLTIFNNNFSKVETDWEFSKYISGVAGRELAKKGVNNIVVIEDKEISAVLTEYPYDDFWGGRDLFQSTKDALKTVNNKYGIRYLVVVSDRETRILPEFIVSGYGLYKMRSQNKAYVGVTVHVFDTVSLRGINYGDNQRRYGYREKVVSDNSSLSDPTLKEFVFTYGDEIVTSLISLLNFQ